MDPFSTAGLGLGAASLAIQVFDGARKGFEIFQNASHADQSFRAYQLRLKIEFERLKEWKIASGLGDDKREAQYERQMKHNGALVVAALTRLSKVLKELRIAELKYDDLTDGDAMSKESVKSKPSKARDIAEPRAGTVYSCSDELQAALSLQEAIPDQKEKSLQRVTENVTRPLKQLKRFRYAMTDSKKFAERLVEISRLIDFLQEMLTQDQLSILIEKNEEFKLHLLQLTKGVHEMKALLWAGQAQVSKTAVESSAASLDGVTLGVTEDSTEGIVHGQTQEARITAFWVAATKFSIGVNDPGVSVKPAEALDQDDIPTICDAIDANIRATAKMLDKRRVWVEWRHYTPSVKETQDGNMARVASSDILKRVQGLVALLARTDKPTQFCVPHCLGYFQDKKAHRFGLVFEPPREASWPPISLLSSFATAGVTLKTKIHMAQQLAQWLLYLHAVNWLHKGFRSASVLFFPHGEQKNLSHPYVADFEFSRVARGHPTTPGPDASDLERAPYIHPGYLSDRQGGFKKTYDMYSLGIVLLEIAHWKSITKIFPNALVPDAQEAQAVGGAEQEETAAILEPEEDPELVFNDFDPLSVIGHVEEVMGEAYAAATRVCLEGMPGLGLSSDQDQSDVSVAAMVQQAYIEKVVHPLKKIFI